MCARSGYALDKAVCLLKVDGDRTTMLVGPRLRLPFRFLTWEDAARCQAALTGLQVRREEAVGLTAADPFVVYFIVQEMLTPQMVLHLEQAGKADAS